MHNEFRMYVDHIPYPHKASSTGLDLGDQRDAEAGPFYVSPLIASISATYRLAMNGE